MQSQKGIAVEDCRSLLRCPVCASQLEADNKTFQCSQGHSFDISREGYVNLWLPDGSPAKIRGDAKEMLHARRQFLESGHYDLLSDTLNETVGQVLEPSLRQAEIQPAILDVGCGDGYYIGRLSRYLKQSWQSRDFCLFGMDLAKEAVRLAARRFNDIQFFVADVRNPLLFPDTSIDVLLNVFAPRNVSEFARVLKPHGALLIVIPTSRHLSQLREALPLLAIEEDKEANIIELARGAFQLSKRQAIEIEMQLSHHQMRDLLQMTPNYWHFTPSDWQRLQEMPVRRVKASFTILEFERYAEKTI